MVDNSRSNNSSFFNTQSSQNNLTLQAIEDASAQQREVEGGDFDDVGEETEEIIGGQAQNKRPSTEALDIPNEERFDEVEDIEDVENDELEQVDVKALQKSFAERLNPSTPSANYKTSYSWFFVQLMVAAPIDIVIFLTGWIPLVGQIMSIILKGCGVGWIIVCHLLDGGKIDRQSIRRFISGGVTSLIPIVNMLPTLSAMTVMGLMQADVESKIGDQVSNVVGEDVKNKTGL